MQRVVRRWGEGWTEGGDLSVTVTYQVISGCFWEKNTATLQVWDLTTWQIHQHDRSNNMTDLTTWQIQQHDRSNNMTDPTTWQIQQHDRSNKMTDLTTWQIQQYDIYSTCANVFNYSCKVFIYKSVTALVLYVRHQAVEQSALLNIIQHLLEPVRCI